MATITHAHTIAGTSGNTCLLCQKQSICSEVTVETWWGTLTYTHAMVGGVNIVVKTLVILS